MSKRMREKDFQSQIISLAQQLGWLCYHTYDSRRSEPGFPDLVLVKHQVLYRELKIQNGKLTPAQKVWADRLRVAGADYAVWRPENITDIVSCLTQH